MIVWATTFSLFTLFLPKLHAFFIPDDKESDDNVGKASDLSGRQRTNRRNNAIGIVLDDSPINENMCHDDDDEDRFTPPILDYDNQSDMMSLNYMVNNSQHPLNNSQVKLSNISRNGRMQGVLMEVHEVRTTPLYNIEIL